MNGNKFIVFDGPNKSGKSRQIELLEDKLRAKSFSVKTTREPGGNEIAELLRSILLSDVERPPETDSLLFNAARAATVKTINEWLIDHTVIADRSYLATLAFQIYGDGAPDTGTRTICNYALGDNYNPDAFFVLDIDYDTYLQRFRGHDEHDYFERGRGHFERVREGFLIEGKKIGAFIIDATQTAEEVHNDIWAKVEEKL